VKGFCPSFVTVEGAKLKKGKGVAEPGNLGPLPDPVLPAIDQTYNVIITGVGGTGVVTIGAILGMAAHLEGKGIGVIDMAGLAQKGGSVYSHLRIARQPEDIHAIRVAASGADLVIGGDMVVAGTKKRSCPESSPAMPTSRCQPSASAAPSSPPPAPTRATSSTRRGLPLRCSASRSAPTCSWSAMPISTGRCPSRPTRSSRRSG
jgi:hypothetical protein